MKTVWKYPLTVTESQIVLIPKGAAILTVQTQNDMPFLWAQVDTNAPPVPRYIAIIGTGIQSDVGHGGYISTFQILGGKLVFHAFEVNGAAIGQQATAIGETRGIV